MQTANFLACGGQISGRPLRYCLSHFLKPLLMNCPLPFAPRFFFCVLFGLALVLPGCKKDDPPPPAPTNSEKILGTWIEKELWTDDDRDGTFVLHSEPCDGDAIWTFNANQTQRIQDATPCDVPFPIDLISTWKIIGDSTHLQLIIPGLEDEPVNLRIDALSDTEMILHTIWPSNPSLPAEDKMVLRR